MRCVCVGGEPEVVPLKGAVYLAWKVITVERTPFRELLLNSSRFGLVEPGRAAQLCSQEL